MFCDYRLFCNKCTFGFGSVLHNVQIRYVDLIKYCFKLDLLYQRAVFKINNTLRNLGG